MSENIFQTIGNEIGSNVITESNRGRKPSFQMLKNQTHLSEIIKWYKATPMGELKSNEQKFFKSLIDRDFHATEEEMHYDVFGYDGRNAGVRNAMGKLWKLGYPIYPAQYGSLKMSPRRKHLFYKQCYYLEFDPVWVKKLEKIKPLIDKDKMNYEVALTRYLRKFPERSIQEECVILQKSVFYQLNEMDVSREQKTKMWNLFKQNETTKAS